MVEEEIEEGVFKKYPISITSTVINNSLATTEGFYKFFEISLSIEYSDIDLSEVFDVDILTEMFRPLMVLQGFIEEEEEPEKNESAQSTTST